MVRMPDPPDRQFVSTMTGYQGKAAMGNVYGMLSPRAGEVAKSLIGMEPKDRLDRLAPFRKYCGITTGPQDPLRSERWKTPQEDVACSKVILARRPSRFLKSASQEAGTEPEPAEPPEPPNPILSCQEKLEKLKALLKKRKEPAPEDVNVETVETTPDDCKSPKVENDISSRNGGECGEKSETVSEPKAIIVNPIKEEPTPADKEPTKIVEVKRNNLQEINVVPVQNLTSADKCNAKPVENHVDICNSAVRVKESSEKITVDEVDNISCNSSPLDISPVADGSKQIFGTSPSTIYEDEFERNLDRISKKRTKKNKRRNKTIVDPACVNDKPQADDAAVQKKKTPKKHKKKKGRKGLDDKAQNEHVTSDIKPEDCKIDQTVSNDQTSPKKQNKKHKNHKKWKHFKTDSSSPIYFCPETSKLFTNKKVNKSSKKKNDSWSVNTLVDKYISFLNRPDRRNKIVHQSSGESLENVQFDEKKGKFVSNCSDNESEDAFAIICADARQKPSDRPKRTQLVSECDSEDSFVICFESDCENDDTDAGVFINDDSWTSDEDGESGDEDTLREPALKGCMKKPRSRGSSPKSGALKTVTFDETPPVVHKITEWSLEYHLARIGPWQGYARDEERFRQRIIDLSMSLDWVFKREHRSRIFFQRFRPILMRQIREEKAEKARQLEILKKEKEEMLKKEKLDRETQIILQQYKDDMLKKKEEKLNNINNNEPSENVTKNVLDEKTPCVTEYSCKEPPSELIEASFKSVQYECIT